MIKQKERQIRSFVNKQSKQTKRKSSLKKTIKVSEITDLKDFKQENVVIAVEGSVLTTILGSPELEDAFFKMSLSAKSVICCRVSPKQKADVVHMYRKRGNWVTLSIGDGANDVSMIMEANIGVGIRGKEGT